MGISIPGTIPSRTPQTERAYCDRAQRLIAAIPGDLLSMPDRGVTPVDAANWLLKKAPELRKSALRQYKSALIFFFEKKSKELPELHPEYQKGLKALQGISGKLCQDQETLPVRTSSGKVKRISMDDLLVLARKMYQSTGSVWRKRAFLWLLAGMACGLRPCEWEHAEIIEDHGGDNLTLQTRNAKNTNGRAGAETREIQVLVSSLAQAVRQHLGEIRAFMDSGGNFKKYFDNARTALSRTVRKIWPNNPRKHYSLYSGRHQFCANLKKSEMSLTQIAQLMGHASTRTAVAHYGRKITGNSKLAPSSPAAKINAQAKLIKPGKNTLSPSM